jgi:hypothetical protein
VLSEAITGIVFGLLLWYVSRLAPTYLFVMVRIDCDQGKAVYPIDVREVGCFPAAQLRHGAEEAQVDRTLA